MRKAILSFSIIILIATVAYCVLETSHTAQATKKFPIFISEFQIQVSDQSKFIKTIQDLANQRGFEITSEKIEPLRNKDRISMDLNRSDFDFWIIAAPDAIQFQLYGYSNKTPLDENEFKDIVEDFQTRIDQFDGANYRVTKDITANS